MCECICVSVNVSVYVGNCRQSVLIPRPIAHKHMQSQTADATCQDIFEMRMMHRGLVKLITAFKTINAFWICWICWICCTHLDLLDCCLGMLGLLPGSVVRIWTY